MYKAVIATFLYNECSEVQLKELLLKLNFLGDIDIASKQVLLLYLEKRGYDVDQSALLFAVRLSDTVKQVIHDNIMDLTSIFQFKRWVHMEDYHITLAFLGSVEEDRLSSVIQLVGDAIKEENSFPLHVEGLDIFGNKRSPRVFGPQ